MRRTACRLILLAFLIALAGCSGNQPAPAPTSAQSATPSVSPSPTPTATPPPVPTNWKIPESRYADGSMISPLDLGVTIVRELKNPASLKVWYICGDELTAEADTLQGWGQANHDFAQSDPPLGQLPQEQADSRRNLSEQHLAMADHLRQAAKQAYDAQIPCTEAGIPPDRAHYLELDSVGPDAKPARISDYSVLGAVFPVEYYQLFRKCATEVGYEAQTAHNRPVATEPDNPPWTTWSAKEKAVKTAQLDATLMLLTKQPVPCE
jgi:hypothetical protein